MDYHFADGDQQRGPFTLEQLSSFSLKPETLVWHDGLTQWTAARELPELAGLFAPPAAVTAVPSPPVIPLPVPSLPYQAPIAATGNSNGMAIASLVLGIVALVTMFCDGFGLIPGILAIIFGHMARRQIAQSGLQGRGMATAGIICGWIAVGLVVMGIIAIVVLIAVSQHSAHVVVAPPSSVPGNVQWGVPTPPPSGHG